MPSRHGVNEVLRTPKIKLIISPALEIQANVNDIQYLSISYKYGRSMTSSVDEYNGVQV